MRSTVDLPQPDGPTSTMNSPGSIARSRLHRGGVRASFTVRKVSFGQGVERIFPLHSPTIAKVEVIRSARVRRAKLYFLRDLKGKAARMKETKRA